jgi:hypothetical protein
MIGKAKALCGKYAQGLFAVRSKIAPTIRDPLVLRERRAKRLLPHVYGRNRPQAVCVKCPRIRTCKHVRLCGRLTRCLFILYMV